MKRIVKIFLALLVVIILLAEYSCHRSCRYMRGYRHDVKHGLAH